MSQMEKVDTLDQLIELGHGGHYPLFDREWIQESFSGKDSTKKLSFTEAAEHVRKTYRKMERHGTLEKKKVALSALDTKDRTQFIRSFLKMVEFKALDRLKELH